MRENAMQYDHATKRQEELWVSNLRDNHDDDLRTGAGYGHQFWR